MMVLENDLKKKETKAFEKDLSRIQKSNEMKDFS